MKIDNNIIWYPPPAEGTVPGTNISGPAPTGFWALFANADFPSPPQPDLTGSDTGFAALFGSSAPSTTLVPDPNTQDEDMATGIEPVFSSALPDVAAGEAAAQQPAFEEVSFRELMQQRSFEAAYADPTLLISREKYPFTRNN